MDRSLKTLIVQEENKKTRNRALISMKYLLICSNLSEQQPTVSAVSSSFSWPARRANCKKLHRLQSVLEDHLLCKNLK